MNKLAPYALGAIVSLLLATSVLAQQPQTMRIRGQIEKADGPNLVVKARDGDELHVKLADKPRVIAMVKASLSDVKPGSYIGVTAMPQADGSQRAIAIHIFPEAMRGVGEGYRPWDLRPGSTMTNAAVETTVASVDGQIIMVKYKDGEKKVLVPPGTPIVAYTTGDIGEVKPGAQILIPQASKQADGSLTAAAINVGRGVTPPM